MNEALVYTCTRCRHVSVYDGGTNGHTHHCTGTFVADPYDNDAVNAAYLLGGHKAARAVVDDLNTKRDALPGVSGATTWWCD